MKTPFEKDFWDWQHLRNTWEYKSLSFILRAMVAIVIVIYLLFALPSIWRWAGVEWVRHQPPERFAELVAAGEKSGDFKPALHWLAQRKRSEYALHTPLILEKISILPPGFVAWPAMQAREAGDVEQTRFWMMMARYRLRYDLLRCGNPDLVAQVNDILRTMEVMQGHNELDTISGDPVATADLLQEVLDFDAQNPMRNDPRTTCDAMAQLNQNTPLQPAAPESWAPIRHTLRVVTEQAIADMRRRSDVTPPRVETP